MTTKNMKPSPRQNKKSKAGKNSYAWGLWAEQLCVLVLLCKGYRILGKRIKTPAGEIDILAAKGKTLVVMEVKKRGSDFAAASAIAPRQQSRLMGAAHYILQQHSGFETLRFDAMLFVPKSLPKHIKNAFS